MLRHFHGTPFEPDLRQAIAKLADMLPDNLTVRLDSIGDFLSVLPAVEAEYDPDSFCALLRAVVGQRQLDMVYWTASRNETTRRDFDPYELSLVDDGWYVFGYCHKAAEIRQFAVQRVRLVKETGETFDRPADFRAVDYMKGSFRAMRGGGEYAVVLRFASGTGSWRNHPRVRRRDGRSGRRRPVLVGWNRVGEPRSFLSTTRTTRRLRR